MESDITSETTFVPGLQFPGHCSVVSAGCVTPFLHHLTVQPAEQAAFTLLVLKLAFKAEIIYYCYNRCLVFFQPCRQGNLLYLEMLLEDKVACSASPF